MSSMTVMRRRACASAVEAARRSPSCSGLITGRMRWAAMSCSQAADGIKTGSESSPHRQMGFRKLCQLCYADVPPTCFVCEQN